MAFSLLPKQSLVARAFVSRDTTDRSHSTQVTEVMGTGESTRDQDNANHHSDCDCLSKQSERSCFICCTFKLHWAHLALDFEQRNPRSIGDCCWLHDHQQQGPSKFEVFPSICALVSDGTPGHPSEQTSKAKSVQSKGGPGQDAPISQEKMRSMNNLFTMSLMGKLPMPPSCTRDLICLCVGAAPPRHFRPNFSETCFFQIGGNLPNTDKPCPYQTKQNPNNNAPLVFLHSLLDTA